MKTTIRLLLLSLFISITTITAQSQSRINDAEREFSEFSRLYLSKSTEPQAYNALYRAYEGYEAVLRTAVRGSSDWNKAKQSLTKIFPYLKEAAYFHARLNDQVMVLKYAGAHVKLSLLPGMDSKELMSQPGYSSLAYLAAINTYNRRDYSSAERYFEAFLSTGDTKNREQAFEGLARCYYESKQFDDAAEIAIRGIEYYPSNWTLLLIGIESSGYTGNHRVMAPLLSRALSVKPGHTGLLEYQGKMFERSRQYEQAVNTFKKLYSGNRTSLDYACHLAFDNYNAGAAFLQNARSSKTDTSERNVLETRARQYFSEAIPLFNDIMESSPYAANIARALAVCYSVTGNQNRLDEANRTLAALQLPSIAMNVTPGFETQYNPTANYNMTGTIADNQNNYALSDVDINIPVNPVKNEKTFAVIIGNEKYASENIPDVPYANNDARVFRDYCIKTLGIPDENAILLTDATYTQIKERINQLKRFSGIHDGNIDLIFYYAGHGTMGDDKKSYLIPSDASGYDMESCIDILALCQDFDKMDTRSSTMFIDACYTNFDKSRFVRIEKEDITPQKGNTIVFNATSGKQKAYPFNEQRHGIFTYYLLKNLQETKGNITLEKLGSQLKFQVSDRAARLNNSDQIPGVNASPSLGDRWKSWTLLSRK